MTDKQRPGAVDREYIADVLFAGREIQEYLWGDVREPGDHFELWKELLQKRMDRIEAIDFDNPSAVIELRKRLLQNAALSVAWLKALDKLDDPSVCLKTKDGVHVLALQQPGDTGNQWCYKCGQVQLKRRETKVSTLTRQRRG